MEIFKLTDDERGHLRKVGNALREGHDDEAHCIEILFKHHQQQMLQLRRQPVRRLCVKNDQNWNSFNSGNNFNRRVQMLAIVRVELRR